MKLKIICIFFLFSLTFAQEKIVIIGDSLSEGYGISKEASYPYLIQEEFFKRKIDYKIINASISGSTTSSLDSRLNWYLKMKPKYVIISLGANDGLRGLNLDNMKKNLEAAIVKIKGSDVEPILFQMKLPLNYGKDFRLQFEKIINNLISKYKLKTSPFMLQNVAGRRELNLADGVHPNVEGHKVIAKDLLSFFIGLTNDKNK